MMNNIVKLILLLFKIRRVLWLLRFPCAQTKNEINFNPNFQLIYGKKKTHQKGLATSYLLF